MAWQTAADNHDDVADLIITEEQLRDSIGLSLSKAKALVLLLVKIKRLRIVAKDRYTLPK